jgi:hypothetical protein
MEPVNEIVPTTAVAPGGEIALPVEVVNAPGGEASPAAAAGQDGAAERAGLAAPAASAVDGGAETSAHSRLLIHDGERTYPSLYDSTPTTIIAIVFGIAIVGGIQVLVKRLWISATSEHVYLTRFVTTLVALVVGCYIADLLIAGPSTQLLSPDEKTLILTFVKDTALMIFSYYFGLKAQAPADGAAPSDTE